jgi:hypothetical protein
MRLLLGVFLILLFVASGFVFAVLMPINIQNFNIKLGLSIVFGLISLAILSELLIKLKRPPLR